MLPKQIKTEDTFRTSKQHFLLCDMNINDRLFVEIKMFQLRKFSPVGWKAIWKEIIKERKKLKTYVKVVKAETAFKVRHPVVGVWFWKNDPEDYYVPEQKLIGSDLRGKLENLKNRLKGENVTLLYGPEDF